MAIAVANYNSYVTLAEANAYLAASIRASTAWAALAPAKKERSLVSATRIFEKQSWLGSKANLNVIATVAINAGGTGYAVGDILTISGGTGVAATVKVLTLATTAVATVEILNVGIYSVNPSASAAATSGGSGSGCTVDLVFAAQVLSFPRTGLYDKDGVALSGLAVPQAIKDAVCEYAYELSQDPSLETGRNSDDLTKRLKAGSVEIENFRAVTRTGRFPYVVQELIGLFLAASTALAAPYASGTGDESAFVDENGEAPFGLSRGFDG